MLCFDKFCSDKFCGDKFSDDMFWMGSSNSKLFHVKILVLKMQLFSFYFLNNDFVSCFKIFEQIQQLSFALRLSMNKQIPCK